MSLRNPSWDMGLQLALGPLLLAQGLYVRKTISKLPEPQGDRAGICGSGRELHMLILGDSAAAGVGAASQPDCDYMGVRSGGEIEVTGVHQMAADGFHPGPEICALWGEAASKRIRARWDSAASH